MKIYISTDLEGIGGVSVWEQTRDKTTALYQTARRLLTQETNAAVEGCLAGGAEEVVVLDGHGGGFNFVPEELHPGARYVTGPRRPQPYCGLDESVAAAMLVGYHAMAGTPNAVLAHTQSSRSGNRYWYNGQETGEIGQTALICGHYGVPVILVTGDEATCREARAVLGDSVTTVSVKKGLGTTCCEMLAPTRACELVREGAAEAMGRIEEARPYLIDRPIRARLQFATKDIADQACCERSTRIDERTYERTMQTQLEVYQF
ncbi:MAG: M55 family metallopeptidase [Planctomycetota bacterium]